MESRKAAFQHRADVHAGKVPNQGPHAAALAQGQQLAGQGQSQQQAAAAQADPAEGAAATGTEDAAMG